MGREFEPARGLSSRPRIGRSPPRSPRASGGVRKRDEHRTNLSRREEGGRRSNREATKFGVWRGERGRDHAGEEE